MATPPQKALFRGFRPPIVAPTKSFPETANVSFADLVRLLAEGIADAQTALDRASAEMALELAETEIQIVPAITETIDADGGITYDRAEAQTVSLLDIGMSPTFYQFAEATVEVSMDVHIVENEDSQTKEKRKGLFASTRDVTIDRKFNRDTKTAAKLTARLVPVPSPLRITPVRRTVDGQG